MGVTDVSGIPKHLREFLDIDWWMAVNVSPTSLAPPSIVTRILVDAWPPTFLAVRVVAVTVPAARSVAESRERAVRVQHYVMRDGEFLWRTTESCSGEPTMEFLEDQDRSEADTPSLLWVAYEKAPFPKLKDIDEFDEVPPAMKLASRLLLNQTAWKFEVDSSTLKVYFEHAAVHFRSDGVFLDPVEVSGLKPVRAYGSAVGGLLNTVDRCVQLLR